MKNEKDIENFSNLVVPKLILPLLKLIKKHDKPNKNEINHYKIRV